MKNKSFVILPITLIIVCSLAIYLLIGGNVFSDNVGNINSNVTNEITNKTVEYENITVEDLQSAVVEAVKKVENAVIGVTCKQIMTSGYGQWVWTQCFH